MKHQSFDFNINPHAPLFVIGVVSEMVSIPIWTLRKLDDLQVVTPKRVGKQTRCYSKIQIRTLARIGYLMKEKGVSISNIKVFLELTE